jgi:hypothetical protein
VTFRFSVDANLPLHEKPLNVKIVQPGEGVLLPLVGCPSPVIENKAVLPGRVSKGHPLPRPNFPHAKLGLQLFVAFV